MDIRYLKGVGEKRALLLEKLGVNTLSDLVNFFPRSYEDWTNLTNLDSAKNEKNCCVKVKIFSKYKPLKLKNGKFLYKIGAICESKNIELLIFNSKYSYEKLIVGNEYILRGNVVENFGKFQIFSPKINDGKEKIVPIYRQCKGINSKTISSLIRTALNIYWQEIFTEVLPQTVIRENNLCSRGFAIENIHFPKDLTSLKKARERIIFEEFFFYHLNMKSIKNKARQITNKVILKDYSEEFYNLLPFKITDSQKSVVSECLEDMKDLSMNRLLQGDVGSGKTAVAAALAYVTVKNGYQVVLMAPTELLSIQHYKTFCEFFKNTGINVNVIYGSMKLKERKCIQEDISLGNADIIIGTHALLSEKINFKNVGLTITDEQHRFGVKQREILVNKGNFSHVLVMSATPIPRTLAMILYGDLDISILNSVLPGRKKVDTFYIDSSKKTRMFNFLNKIIAQGSQVYIVCASIEKNENNILDVQSCKDLLIKYGFIEADIAILHSKMKPCEKDKIMKCFSEGKIKILVSTTVIEVGIDVPNATVIVIENAERFGISQLHQLRGRVGRGNKKSYCILVSDSKSKESFNRFSALTHSGDGFYLSEEDLKIRGPGDFFGVNQHGVPNIKISTSYEDMPIVYNAQNWAKKIIENKRLLKDKELKLLIEKLSSYKTSDLNSESQKVIF